ncbi:MAG: hypothetical protein LCH36_02685 [Actinobacteria bacterium]|nr:hypothetical protein [Actinomycetota bacterium]
MPAANQLTFDLDELVREDLRANAGAWQGAPLHFTTDYYPPGELVTAFQQWQLLYGNYGSIPRSHMWHPDYLSRNGQLSFDGHGHMKFRADLSPEREHEGPGELLYMAVCEPCEWHDVSDSENDVVEAWHDHAIPGWRELPVIPAQIRVSNESGRLTPLAQKWVTAHYPAEMQVPGVPIITERQRYATRHVEGRSPWGGYDLSSTALTRAEPPHQEDTPRPAPATLQTAAPDRAPTVSTPHALSR